MSSIKIVYPSLTPQIELNRATDFFTKSVFKTTKSVENGTSWISHIYTLRNKWSFPLRISSVNVAKLKKSSIENFIFCAVTFFDIGRFVQDIICSKFLGFENNLYKKHFQLTVTLLVRRSLIQTVNQIILVFIPNILITNSNTICSVSQKKITLLCQESLETKTVSQIECNFFFQKQSYCLYVLTSDLKLNNLTCCGVFHKL